MASAGSAGVDGMHPTYMRLDMFSDYMSHCMYMHFDMYHPVALRAAPERTSP